MNAVHHNTVQQNTFHHDRLHRDIVHYNTYLAEPTLQMPHAVRLVLLGLTLALLAVSVFESMV
ncbi:MAG: hypothetical protein AAGF24_05650 [Cyanobacteria bacterium P01_H01_bin.121]